MRYLKFYSISSFIIDIPIKKKYLTEQLEKVFITKTVRHIY